MANATWLQHFGFPLISHRLEHLMDTHIVPFHLTFLIMGRFLADEAVSSTYLLCYLWGENVWNMLKTL